jgi:hypothetical protein
VLGKIAHATEKAMQVNHNNTAITLDVVRMSTHDLNKPAFSLRSVARRFQA